MDDFQPQMFYDLEQDYQIGDGTNYHTQSPSPDMRCEITTYECRYNSRNEQVTLQVGASKRFRPNTATTSSVLALTKYYNRADGSIQKTTLEINSPHVNAALRNVVPSYPGIELKAKTISMPQGPYCIFHYRKELQEYGARLTNSTAVKHLLFTLQYMYNTFQKQITDYYHYMESEIFAPGLEFDSLWMAFRPQDLLYSNKKGCHVITRLNRTEYSNQGSQLNVRCECIHFDGKRFENYTSDTTIDRYEGHRALESLPIYPMKYKTDLEETKESVHERGSMYTRLTGVHYFSYDGEARTLLEGLENCECEECGCVPSAHGTSDLEMGVKGNVMIDHDAFISRGLKHRQNSKFKSGSDRAEDQIFSEEDYLICDYEIPAFSLSRKRWCWLYVDRLKNINFNKRAFEQLLLPREEKTMIADLVGVHLQDRWQFDDMVLGKGKGMIFLLHGPPGLGKTLTVESVAEHCERPLYTITSGELGSTAPAIEQRLSAALKLAGRWNAIVLIDEADVFLEQRSATDFERNSLVSVFLRTLEYYQGVLFLTTNRIECLDPAFKSRIHSAIRYKPLPPESRHELFRYFISKATAATAAVDRSARTVYDVLDDAWLQEIALKQLSGRQIKNAVQTAYSMSLANDEPLKRSQITTAINVMMGFEADFEKNHEDRLDNSSAKRRRADVS